mmetsp:Transcript_40378/g.111247  ORF Transcript_40378/g.111247 Transcript_40378/m.111247 type:complete len:993 (-) Transcript_40378:13-2991(-)
MTLATAAPGRRRNSCDEGAVDVWPKKTDLERWLFEAASDVDVAAAALRRLVQANPGYGAYLVEDREITEIVQLFAKRFRKRIIDAESPIQPQTLFKPLCEVIWKALGLVLHSLGQFHGKDAGDACSPIPREAKGHLRMLLQTNDELSCQLRELRRAYLKELSQHRDRQRQFTAHMKAALTSLKEDPVMFYEPLNSLLDQTTKDFITLTVEERIKLNMHTERGRSAEASEDEERNTRQADELEKELEMLKPELKKLRIVAAKETDARRRSEEREAKWKAEAEEARRLMQEHQGAADVTKKMLEESSNADPAKRRLSVHEQQQVQKAEGAGSVAQQQTTGLLAQLSDKDDLIRELQRKLDGMAEQVRTRDQELASAGEKLKEAATAQREMRRTSVNELQNAEAEEEKPRVEAHRRQSVRNTATESVEVRTVGQEGPVRYVEKLVRDDAALEELREELARHLEVERELQRANAALEKALEAAEARPVGGASPEVAPQGTSGQPDTKVETSTDIQEAIANVTKAHEVELQEQADEIERLKAQLREAGVTDVDEPKRKSKTRRFSKDDDGGSDADRLSKLAARYDELEASYEEAMQEKEVLEQKLRALYAKLKENCTDAELDETLNSIDLSPLPPHRKRKKNAFERLYADAQRRISEMRGRAQQLAEEQEREIKAAAARIRNRGQLQRLSMLASLQRASKATNERFHIAMQRFNKLPAVDEGLEGDMGAVDFRWQCPKCGIPFPPCAHCGGDAPEASAAVLPKPASGTCSPSLQADLGLAGPRSGLEKGGAGSGPSSPCLALTSTLRHVPTLQDAEEALRAVLPLRGKAQFARDAATSLLSPASGTFKAGLALPPPELRTPSSRSFLAQTLPCVSRWGADEVHDTMPTPPPAMASTPSSPARPVIDRTDHLARSVLAQGYHETPWVLQGQVGSMKGTRSLPSLSAAATKDVAPAQAFVNRAFEVPRRPGLKAAKHRFEHSSSQPRFMTIVKGHEIAG